MVRVKKQPIRSDLSKKAQPSKANKQKPEYKLYQKYLRSDKFKEVKTIVHTRDNERCVCCGRETDLQVHHITYQHLGCGGEIEANDCILMCKICHSAISRAKGNLNKWSDKSPIINNLKISKDENYGNNTDKKI